MFIDTPVFIQARTGSKRFPQKVLADLDGHSILWNVYRQCRQAANNVFVLGIKQDTMLFNHCAEYGIPALPLDIHENDLVGRFAVACGKIGANGFIRVTADCPLIFPQEILWVAMTAMKGRYDFVTNGWPEGRTTPDGVDCEYYSAGMIGWMANNVKDEKHREHSPLYLYEKYGVDNRLDMFRIEKTGWPVDMSKVKFSVDTREDLDKISKGEIL